MTPRFGNINALNHQSLNLISKCGRVGGDRCCCSKTSRWRRLRAWCRIICTACSRPRCSRRLPSPGCRWSASTRRCCKRMKCSDRCWCRCHGERLQLPSRRCCSSWSDAFPARCSRQTSTGPMPWLESECSSQFSFWNINRLKVKLIHFKLTSQSSPVVAVPTKAFYVQTQHVWKSADPKALRWSLLLLAVATVIKLCLGELLDRHEARETVGDVASSVGVAVVNIFVVFFRNVQGEIEERIVLPAFRAAHQAAHLTQQLTLEDVCHKRSLLRRGGTDVVLHLAVGRAGGKCVGNVLKLGVQAVKHIAKEFVCVVLVIAFKLWNDLPDHEEETFRRNAGFLVVCAAVEVDENLKLDVELD